MAAADEPSVDEMERLKPEAELTLQDRLARFLHESYLAAGEAGIAEINTPVEWDELPGPMRAVSDYIAGDVLERFFRVDDARNLYATSGVDSTTLEPFGAVHWGALFGRMRTSELRAVGQAFAEVAELADLEASMARWLLRDEGATIDGVSKIIASFRVFRAELDLAADPETQT